MTDVQAKIYPADIYNSFTPAQKAKHWQLRNMNHQIAEFKTAMSSAATAISDFRAATQKRPADEDGSDLTRDSGWGHDRGSNRENPALGRQDSAAKKPKN